MDTKNNTTTPEREERAADSALSASHGSAWMPMDTAPKDGAEILVWRDDCGILLARWAAPIDFLSETECEELGESAEEQDWFYADFVAGGRLDGCEYPQLWMPLPDEPNVELWHGVSDEGANGVDHQ